MSYKTIFKKMQNTIAFPKINCGIMHSCPKDRDYQTMRELGEPRDFKTSRQHESTS
jgi:hypothetical protein